jgi:hypothetical protein
MTSKEDYIQAQVEGSWEDYKFINQVLYDYFESQVRDMNNKQFKEHLQGLNWEVE